MHKSGFEIVYKGSKVGLQNKDGLEILPCIYDKILDYDDDGYIRIIKGDVYGTIDLDGNKAISHSVGITHLGVFYGGTARARKGKYWGLVDVNGNEVTKFKYQDIKAYHNGGYTTITTTGKTGFLTEDGKFTTSKTKIKSLEKPQFQKIATYRNGIAPAYTKDCKWIFIDKDQNRVGKYEYKTMDPVLRQCLYLVINEDHMYNFCKYDGKPLLCEWYDHMKKFDNGYAIFWKGIRDENGELKIFSGGQPSYMWGVIDLNGNYIVAPNYTNIRWADDQKEFWYAEKWGAKYYLYPDGRRFLIMNSGLTEVGKDPVYQPSTKKDKKIEVHDNPKPEPPKPDPAKHEQHVEETKYVFDGDKFMSKLYYWLWGFDKDELKFYYRDTDCNINVDLKKVYHRGKFFRAGDYLEITEKLQRPVYNTRIIIATNHVTNVNEVLKFNDENRPLEVRFKDSFIHFNSCFMSLGVIKCGGVTQVLLLHLPQSAYYLAERKDYLSIMKKCLLKEGISIAEAAEKDLQEKLGKNVHGYSLSSDWQSRMVKLVGLDASNEPVSMVPSPMDNQTIAENVLSSYTTVLSGDTDIDWEESNFMKIVSIGTADSATSE